MYSFIKKIVFIFTCFCLSGVSYAVVVEGIYTTVLQVQSQQSRDRDAALNDALMDVLLKASGDRDVLRNHEIISRLFPAEQYVVSFSYTENPDYSAYIKQQNAEKAQNRGNDVQSLAYRQQATTVSSSEPVPLPYLIEVNFSENALEQAMKKAGIPIWGSVRPNIIFWVASEEDGQRQLLGKISDKPLLRLLKNDAARFALPILFPEGDQIDTSAVNISNLWGLFPDAVDRANTRYNTDGLLMLRVYKSLSNSWNANWSLTLGDQNYRASVSDVELSKLSESVISHVAGILVERFSIKADDQAYSDGAVKIEVSEIRSFKDYVDLQQFLEKLAAVKQISVESVDTTTVGLSLVLNTSTDKFLEYLNLSGKLTRMKQSLDVSEVPVRFESDPLPQSVFNLPKVERFKWHGSVSDITSK